MAVQGVMHRMAFVDLSSGEVNLEDPGDELYEKFLGGYGLGAWIVYSRQKANVDPLGPEAMLGILRRFSQGEGQQQDIRLLEELANVMMTSSLCGLGQATPYPVVDSLQYFRSDYENRISKN